MRSRNASNRRFRRGIAAITALQFLVVFAAIGVTFAVVTDLEVQKAKNFQAATEARLAAESGLQLCTYVLTGTDMSANPEGEELMSTIAASLLNELSGAIDDGSFAIYWGGTEIWVPEIPLSDRQSFRAQISMLSEVEFRLLVVGCARAGDGADGTTTERTVTMDFEFLHNPAFDYGLFVKGPIKAGYGFKFLGTDDPDDASMYSAASGTAISVEGGYIDGDVDTVQSDAVVNIGATVAGDIHAGVPELEFPQIDGTVFAPFATNVVDAGTNTTSGTFRNIRIKAGTNPVFGNVKIEGVMYVEAPNYVQFANNVVVTGVIVTDVPGEGASLTTHKIEFKNGMTLYGVDHLPDLPEYAELRKMTGSAILAKGFALDFKNNFTSVGGVIAAESIYVMNNLTCTLYGNIIIYGDAGIELKNNAVIKVDRSVYPGVPAGFVKAESRIVPVPDTYVEYTKPQ